MPMTLIFIASLASVFIHLYLERSTKPISNQPSTKKKSSAIFFGLLLVFTAALAAMEIWGTVAGEINKKGIDWISLIRPIIFIGSCVAISVAIRKERSAGRNYLWVKIVLALVALVAFLFTFVGH